VDRNPSADLFCELDNDSLGPADIAEPVAVLVALQFPIDTFDERFQRRFRGSLAIEKSTMS
jgi:hypothetical protein